MDRGRRGRKVAAPNLAVQVGLTDTPMANAGLQTLLHSLDVPSPSTSTLQSRATFVNQKLVEVNKEDMKMRRGNLKKINRLKGLPEDYPIRVEGDARYNNPLYTAAGKTPFQPASQVVYTLCVNVTSNHQLCQTDALQAQRKGGVQKCVTENHVGECTATITAQQSIGDEYRWATDCVEELLEDNITVKYFTTDCDSCANTAAGDCYKHYQKEHSPPRHLKDTQQRRKIINTTFSHAMFPGRLAAQRAKSKQWFADDVVKRCAAEQKEAYTRYHGDDAKLKTALSYSMDAIISCYQGNHASCSKHSFVCDGDKNKWKAPFLKKDTIIKCTQKDEASLRNCLNYRLGRQILNDTKFNTNRQKSEAANRVYNLRNPRNLTFARNFSGRIHSAVHQINNGPSQSLCLHLEAIGAPITANSRVAHQLKSKGKKHRYNKDYKKTEYAKTRRSTLRINKYRL